MKKVISLLLAMIMVMSLAACGSGDDPGTENPGGNDPGTPGGGEGVIDFNEDPYEVSIQFVGLFESNTDIPAIEEALNKITLEKINCTVDIVPVFIGDLPKTTSMGVAGDEKMDIVTVGLTSGITSMVSDELLLPLDELLAQRGQTALEITKDVAEGQKVNGQTYAVTGNAYAATASGFVYNKTLANEYGIEMHDDMTPEELFAVGEKLKEHGVYLTHFSNSTQCNYKFWYGGDLFGPSGEYGGILNPASSTEVVNIYDSKEMRDYFKMVRSWNEAGFLPPGQLTDTTSVNEYFSQQKIFIVPGSYAMNLLASWQFPNFETASVRLTDPVVSTSGVIEYMLGIAANCERPDKAMDLINLIYADADVANLLQYGVEGTDYVAVEGTQNVITRTGTPNADGNGYSSPFVHFGDPMKLKILTPLTDSYYDDVKNFESESHKSQLFGYSFDSADFNAESGAISNVLQQLLPMLNAGEAADVEAAVDELVKALQAAGIDDVIAANQGQVNTFLGK